MTKKLLVLLVGAVALSLGAWHLYEPPASIPTSAQTSAQTSARPEAPTGANEMTAQTPATDLAPPPDDTLPAVVRESLTVPASLARKATEQELPEGWPLPIEVRFRLILDDGTALEDLDGEVELTVWHDAGYGSELRKGTRSGKQVSASIVDGLCNFDALPATMLMNGPNGVETSLAPSAAEAHVALELKRILLDGAQAVPVAQQGARKTPKYPVGRGPLVIDVQRPFELVLHVKDALEDRHLDGVRAVYFTPDNMFGMDFSESRPSQPAFEQLSSPIRYRPPLEIAKSQRVVFHVHAPGQRWTRAVLNPQKDGTHEILMERGGLADVLIDGPVDDQTYLQVWSVESGPMRKPDRKLRVLDLIDTEEETVPSARLTLEGLALGEQTLELVHGKPGASTPRLGSTRFTVVADETASVFVTLDSDLRPRLARLSGSLWIAPHWRERNELLKIEGTSGQAFTRPRIELALADMAPSPNDPNLYFWDAGEPLTGPYSITLEDPPIGLSVEVGPEGVHDAHLEVSDPARVSIDVIDEVTGLRLESCHVSWNVESASRMENVERDAKTGRYELTAPRGHIRVVCSARNYCIRSERLEVNPGQNTHTLRAQPTSELKLKLMDGDHIVPLPIHITELHIERPDGSPMKHRSFGHDGSFETLSLDPGRCRLEMPAIHGYQPIPPRELDLRPGESLTLVIELIRR